MWKTAKLGHKQPTKISHQVYTVPSVESCSFPAINSEFALWIQAFGWALYQPSDLGQNTVSSQSFCSLACCWENDNVIMCTE